MAWALARAGRGTRQEGTGRGGAGRASKGYSFFKP